MRVYDTNTGQWVERPTAQGGAPAGLTTGPGGAYLRAPNERNTVAGQMKSLLREDGDYMKINEKKGQQFAAGRGLLNSSLAGQAGRQAAIAGAQPIAMADAQLQAQADAQNAEALNAVYIADLAKQTATAQANSAGYWSKDDAGLEFERQKEIMRLASELNITEAEADRMFRREQSNLDRGMTREGWDRESAESARDRGWRSGESALDRDLTRTMSREEWDRQRDEAERDRGWRSSEAERDRAYDRESSTRDSRFSMFRDVMTRSLDTIFSSPDYFRDPAAASGFLDFFTGQFGSLFDRFFAPGGG